MNAVGCWPHCNDTYARNNICIVTMALLLPYRHSTHLSTLSFVSHLSYRCWTWTCIITSVSYIAAVWGNHTRAQSL